MPSTKELTTKRRKELLAMGYKPGIVDLAIAWALGCSEGMVNYVTKTGLDDKESDHDGLIAQFLPQYLQDCENWMRAFGNRRTGEET